MLITHSYHALSTLHAQQPGNHNRRRAVLAKRKELDILHACLGDCMDKVILAEGELKGLEARRC